MFPLLPALAASSAPFGRFGVPTVQDWHGLWASWDFVTLNMISPPMLYQKPIDLRHICLFYLGHIPTFLDIHLSSLLGEPHTEPEVFKVRSSSLDVSLSHQHPVHASISSK